MTEGAIAAPLPRGYEEIPHTIERLRPRRRAIARNLELAAKIPSLTADMQIDLTLLRQLRAEWGGDPSDKPSVLGMLSKAAVATLLEFPDLNATLTERELIRWSTINLGVAVDAPGGLLVPVITDAQVLSATELTRAVASCAERARTNALVAEDFAGGTFTISNPGAVGPSIRAEALLNVPQIGLLGLPGIKRIPLVVEGEAGESVEIRSVICPSLTFDHRAVDGGYAIRYLSSLAGRLDNWSIEDYAAST